MSGKLESIAQATTPIPAGVSGAIILGLTVQEWILIGTGVLVVFQLIVIAPKVFSVLRDFVRKFI